MRIKNVLLLSAAALAMSMQAVTANDRYATPPPLTISPDLASPWVLQLRNAPVARDTARSGVTFGQETSVRRKQTDPDRGTGIFSGFRQTQEEQPVFSQPERNGHYAYLRRPEPQPVVSAPSQSTQSETTRRQIDPRFLPQIVAYETSQKPGTIIIDTGTRYLYLVLGDGKARRYGVGVGKQGFEWSGSEKISRKAEWPSWRPPQQMIERERKKGRELPTYMAGGPENPLGARALYLGNTLYRIHGTNQPWTIGQAVSSGCIRMRNEDVMDLYERARVGAKVIVS